MKAKDNKYRRLFLPQIPLITLIGVLLSLSIFTFHYAANYTTFGVATFNLLIKLGGRLILGYFFFPVFSLLTLGVFGLLIYELIHSFRG